MSRIWKGLWAVVALTSMVAASSASLAYAQEESAPAASEVEQKDEENAPAASEVEQKGEENAPAASENEQKDEENASENEQKDKGDAIEFDESESQDDVNAALDEAAESELGDAAKSNSPEELLNLATETKLTASTLLDLTKVVSLCNKAEKLGLDEYNREYARQLRISAQLDRGLAIAQLFMDPELDIAQLPRGWEGLRDSAIADLKTVVEENPDVAAVQLGLGRLYMLSDKPEEAKAAFDAAINGVDDSGEVQVQTLAYMFRADLESDAKLAIPYIEKALEICPTEEPRLYALYTEYLARCGRVDEALKAIDKGIEISDNPEFKKQKARVLVMLRRKDEARALYDEATKDAADNLVAQIDKGQFLASIGDQTGALDLFTGLIKKFDGPGLYFFRGAVYADMKDYDKAMADANQALRRDGNLLPALRLKGVVYLQQEKYDDAIRTFEQLRRKAKTDEEKLEATNQIAFVISKQGHYKRASEMLKKELEKDPKNVEILRSLADMELFYGHWGEAKRIYAELLEIDPEDTGVLNNYSWLLGTCPDDQYRDAALALEYGKKAAEGTQYTKAHILSTLAAAYAENGDFESARSWAQKGVDIATEDNDENLEDLKKELESYKENKPWRETTEIMTEVEEDEKAEEKAEEKTEEKTEENAAEKEEGV